MRLLTRRHGVPHNESRADAHSYAAPMIHSTLRPLLVALILTSACFEPERGTHADVGTTDDGTGTTSAASSSDTIDPPSPTTETMPADGTSAGTTGAATSEPAATSESGEPEACTNACDPDLTASCAFNGTVAVQCTLVPSGCLDYELTECGAGVCVPDGGCVALLPASCAEILAQDPDAADGTYSIDVDGPGGLAAFDAVCDMSSDGGGWTLVARNDATDTFVTFDRSWADYKHGFGDLVDMSRGWLGNDRIHFLTGGGKDLRVLHDQGVHHYADFSVANEVSQYQMVVTTTPASQDAGNFEQDQGGQFFSTHDHDNDKLADESCAEIYSTGWWHESCYDMSIAGSANGGVYWRNAAGNPVFVEWIELWVR